jgi:hypothetical protein
VRGQIDVAVIADDQRDTLLRVTRGHSACEHQSRDRNDMKKSHLPLRKARRRRRQYGGGLTNKLSLPQPRRAQKGELRSISNRRQQTDE